MPTAEAAAPRQWTHGEGSETSPRWSPDGKFLLFTSEREEKKAQLFVLPTEGGEAEKVTDLPQGSIAQARWSPDQTRIAFSFRALDVAWREDAIEERKKNKRSSPPREITRLRYREEGGGYLGSERYQVHVLELTTRVVTPITSGDRDHGPFCWSPDGKQIAYIANTADDPDQLPNTEDLFVVSVEVPTNGTQPTKLNCPQGPKSAPAWSPDQTHIAYAGHDKPDEVWGVTNIHPWVVPVDSGAARDLVPGSDVHCDNASLGDVTGSGEDGPFWSADSSALLFLASERGAVDVYRAPINNTNAGPERLTRGLHAVRGLSPDQRGPNFALLLATPADAGDVYALASDPPEPRRVTHVNQDLFDEVNVVTPVFFEAPSPDGHTVPCWALVPPGATAGALPTVVYLHGGPHLMVAHTLFHEYQALAAAGYMVLYPNPRGSKGYGEAWTAAIQGNWGEPAHADVIACVDYAVAQGWSDPARLGVAGGSYGGYLTAWIVGHTNRFAAAVAERGVYNLQSMAGTCDFVWIDRGYFDANTWDDPAAYLRNSPLSYAGNIDTPLLLIHSEGDLRCPIEQAEQMYAALKRQQKPVVFVRYGPEANHDLSRGGPPDLRLDRLRRITAWFDQHLKNAAPTRK